MVQVKFGKVKWFSFQKGFGFLIDEEGREVFFHLNDAHFIDRDPDDVGPHFSEPVRLKFGEAPRPGAEIVFVEEKKFRGPQAVKWGSAERWHRLMDEVVPVHKAAVKIGRRWGAEVVKTG